MVNFIIQGVPVGIHQGKIFTVQPRIKQVLERYLEDKELIGPGDGDPDWALAKFFCGIFGGRILKGDSPKVDPNVVY